MHERPKEIGKKKLFIGANFWQINLVAALMMAKRFSKHMKKVVR